MLLYLPLAVLAAFGAPLPTTWYVKLCLILPLAFALMVCFGVVLPAIFRVLTYFASWARLLLFPFNLLWMLEAGVKFADDSEREDDALHDSVRKREELSAFKEKARRGRLSLRERTMKIGAEVHGNLRIEGGEVRSGEERVGTLRETHEGFEVVGPDGKVALRFDEHGRDREGELVAHPEGWDPEEWEALVESPEPEAPDSLRSRLGPLLHSVVILTLTAGSYYLGEALHDLHGVGSESEATAAAPESSDPEPSAPARAEARTETSPETSPRAQTEREIPCPLGEVRASRYLRSGGNYRPQNAFDGQVQTAWAIADAQPGEDWIEVALRRPTRITRALIVTGYDKVNPRIGDLFVMNAHLRRYRLVHDEGSLSDQAGPEERRRGLPLGVTSSRLRLVVDEVWPGTRWQDLSISEIELFCAE